MGEDTPKSRNLPTRDGERRPETSAGNARGERGSTAARPETTAGSARQTDARKTNPFDRTVMFAMSPRTYDQTLKGAPKDFKGAQEVDMGTYDRSKFGRSVPHGWDNKPAITSRAELMAKRRSAMIPDNTFDLDGDGCVSKEDYTISLRNDKDRDGRLNTAERKQALSELEAGRPAAKFAALRPITAPEFVRLDSTGWPQTGLPKEVPPTRTALLETRRKELVTKNHKGYLKYEEAMAKKQPAWKKSEEYQLCQTKAIEALPPKKVRSDEIESQKQDKRKFAGLTATMRTLNPDRTALDPSAHISGCTWYEDPKQGEFLGYRENPQFPTRGSLVDDRRTSMLDNLEESVRRVGPTFKTMRMRLEDRENSEFLKAKLALEDPNNRVRSDLTRTRRENNVTQLIGMWGNDPEPPMNDARRATPNSRIPFWTLKDRYKDQPEEQSNMSLTQSRKWFKRVPEKYLAPEPKIWGKGGPVDPYTRPHTRKDPKQDTMAQKVTIQSTSVSDIDPKLKGPYMPRAATRPEIRTEDPSLNASTNYLTDAAVDTLNRRARDMPMFSSFSPDYVFKPQNLSPTGRAGRGGGRQGFFGHKGDEQTGGEASMRRELAPPRPMQDVLRQSASSFPQQANAAVTPRSTTPAAQGPARKSLLDAGTKLRTTGFLGADNAPSRPHTTQRGG